MTRKELEQATVRLCSDLIRAKSYSGKEAEAAAVVRQAMERLGYDEIITDRLGNVIGCLHGKRSGPKILLDGHIDTVPVEDASKWSFDPFGGEITADCVLGRGATDMKGAVAAMICGAAYFAQDRDFAGDVYVAGVVYEELFEGVAPREISRRVQPDYVVIGEATELNLKIGQRGRGELVVETFGKPAHSANPEKGVNAVRLMRRLLDAMDTIPVREHPALGKGIRELTDIISAPYPGASVVPERCAATFDCRLLTGDTPESVLAPVQALIVQLQAADPDFRAAARFRSQSLRCYTGDEISAERFFPAWEYPADAPFVRAAFAAIAPLAPKLTYYSFCTNGSHYAGEAGIPTVGFGPSIESLAHTVDEYVTIDQLEKSAWGYSSLCRALSELGKPEVVQ